MKNTFPYILAACLLLCTGCAAKNTDSATEPSQTESVPSQTEAMQETASSTDMDTVSDLPAESAATESAQTEIATETNAPTETDVMLTPDTYSIDALCEMALDYYEALTGYRPSQAAGGKRDDGMVVIQLYDNLGDHNSTSDWYTVDPMSAVGTNTIGETIDLKSPPEAMPELDALVRICMAEGQSEEAALDTASYMREKAQEFSETLFGEITSEEDAIAKGRDVLMLIGAGDSVERAESEYVEIDGTLVKYQRDGEPWHVEHFPEYDAWRVTPALPSGVTEDGRFVAAPGQPPYIILRGADGAVLGVFH